eukprot:4617673-Heterocapsa_arctica.AAC.1
MGRAWASALRPAPHWWTPQTYGYVPGQRHESAILLMKLAMWRLTSYGLAWMGCWYDMSNAFTSVHHSYLDNVVHTYCHAHDAQLLSLRHRYAMVFIRGQDNDLICVRPTSGDLQGD